MFDSNPISNCHRTADSSHASKSTPTHTPDKKKPRRLPQEWPADQERYTEEITASNRAYHTQNIVSIDHVELVDSPYADPSQADFSRNAAELREAETTPDPGLSYSERTAKQTCDYHEGNKAAPNNNLFFEERSNPLSSKGN